MSIFALLALIVPAGAAAETAAGPRVYWSGDRIAVVSERAVEWYKTPAGASAWVGTSTATAKPLEKTPLPEGSVFFKKGNSFLETAPAQRRPFASDLLPLGHPTGKRAAFVVCARGAAHFCGAMTVAGKEAFRLASRPASGEIQPAGLSGDGSEALFAAVQNEPRREITSWLIRAKDGSQRWVGLGDPDAERLLKRFQGTLVLPSEPRLSP